MRRVPRGVAAVIAPWNFPLAIPTGMTAAALAAGNAVVLKPAEQSPASASVLVEALHAAGVPPDALALAARLRRGRRGAGARPARAPDRVHRLERGRAGDHPRGRRDTPKGQGHVKRVIAEMGGKNCAIVDSDADLDDAIPSIVASAFGYAGQKCSAAARVLAHEAIADALLERLAGAADTLVVGQAEEFATDVPPVIEREARERIDDYRELAAADGRLLDGRQARCPATGWFCPPGGRRGPVEPDSALLRDEVFGPLLTVEAVAGVEEALEIVDGLPVRAHRRALLAQPADDRPRPRAHPGRQPLREPPTTGAMVGRQPFGGNRRSGVGSQAGGPDYLLQFTEPRVVSENTMRHGLETEAAPPEKCDDPLSRARSGQLPTDPAFAGSSASEGPWEGVFVYLPAWAGLSASVTVTVRVVVAAENGELEVVARLLRVDRCDHVVHAGHGLAVDGGDHVAAGADLLAADRDLGVARLDPGLVGGAARAPPTRPGRRWSTFRLRTWAISGVRSPPLIPM